MSNSCVITNTETNEKRGYGCSCNRMDFAIENPELTYTVSPYQTACGIVDIGMHTIERYFCSWAQEMLFGSVSWDYSHMPFNINGRICLIYSVFWGFLGIFWVKTLYPMIAQLILKIPNKAGKILTWALTAFFVFDCAVTLLTVFRWSQRVDGIAASNAFWAFLDTRFPDSRMQRIFANMVFR